MINIQPIFSSFIAIKQLDLDHNAISNWCLSHQLDKGVLHHNRETHSRITLSLKEKELFPLYAEVTKCFQEVHNAIGLDPNIEEFIDHAWVNLGRTERTSIPHYHAGNSLVAVYYPTYNVGSDILCLVHPTSSIEWVFPFDGIKSVVNEHTQFTSHRQMVVPDQGTLIIFPSWVMHYVEPTEENSNRISIALNAKMSI